MADERLKEIVNHWIEKAEHDLLIVQRDLSNSEPITDVVCFHCQQAVEKYLKAYLASRLVKPSKTHDISSIIRECETIDTTFSAIADVAYLSDYAVELRYPDDFYMPTVDDAVKAFEDATMVKKIVSAKIQIVMK